MEKCTFSSIPFKRNGHGTEKKKNGKEKKRQENGAKTRKSMRAHDAQVCKYYAYIRGRSDSYNSSTNEKHIETQGSR